MDTALKTRVGVLGGGQLGRMMGYAAHRLGINLVPLDPKGVKSPAGLVTSEAVKGHFNNPENVYTLANQGCDVITVEIEHVSIDALQKLEQDKVNVFPSSETIRIIQDKYVQKEHLRNHGIPTADYDIINTEEDIKEAAKKWGYPIMLKARKLAYDGRGNAAVMDENKVSQAYEQLGGHKNIGSLYVERWAKFTKELAVMVCKSVTGEVVCYPVVETIQRDNICHTVTTSFTISPDIKKKAREVAKQAIASFDHTAGIFGVELFLLDDGQVLLNEIAPRPHNSGHYTIEACYCDQFENHLRAIIGLPLGDPSLKVGACTMVNVLGDGKLSSTLSMSGLNNALSVSGASVHWYAKEECRKGRKMGHITVCAPDDQTLKERMETLLMKVEKNKKKTKTDQTMGNVRKNIQEESLPRKKQKTTEDN